MQVDYSPLAGNRQAIPSLHSFTNVYQVVMRALVQRVTQAAVHVEGQTVGSIGQGLVILLGIADGDTAAIAEGLAKKIAQMRIFGDSGGRFNLCATRRRSSGVGDLAVHPLCRHVQRTTPQPDPVRPDPTWPRPWSSILRRRWKRTGCRLGAACSALTCWLRFTTTAR